MKKADFCPSRAATNDTAESTILNLIAVALSRHFGALVTRVNAGTFRDMHGDRIIKGAAAGTSDLLVGIPHAGRLLYFAVEVKTPIGRQSPTQAKFQAAVENRGGVYILARSPVEAVDKVSAALDQQEASLNNTS
jgi:hypothetical protein